MREIRVWSVVGAESEQSMKDGAGVDYIYKRFLTLEFVDLFVEERWGEKKLLSVSENLVIDRGQPSDGHLLAIR